ncbi:MAG: hypothetical protein DRP01_07170 [Archaeoglobales archaeon]|nr:MAG: hypothetical protein DRP01_07170 [Archaeoglobales archaeon]
MPNPTVGYDWRHLDIIRRERANGFIGYPNYVESGCNITLGGGGTQIDISAGVIIAGGFRTPITGPFTIIPVGPYAPVYYIYATLTAVFDGTPRLTSITSIQFEAHTAPQVFAHPKYGVLIGMVKSPAGVSLYLSDEMNRNVPAFQGDYRGELVVTVGARGCDYTRLDTAIQEAVDDSVIVVYPGANLTLRKGVANVNNKKLQVVAAPFADFFDPNSGFLIPPVTYPYYVTFDATGPVTQTGVVHITGTSFLTFKGFHFAYSSVGSSPAFYVDGANAQVQFLDCQASSYAPTYFTRTSTNGGKFFFINSKAYVNDSSQIFVSDTGTLGEFYFQDSKVHIEAGRGFACSGGSKLVIIRSKFTSNAVITMIQLGTVNTNHYGVDSKFETTNTGTGLILSGSGAFRSYGCVFQDAGGGGLALSVTGGTFYWDTATRIADNVTSISAVGGTIARPRTPVNSYETVSLADLTAASGFTEATVQTTDATLTTIATIPISDPETVQIDAMFVGIRTVTDHAGYLRRAIVYRRGGGATLLGVVDTPLQRETDNSWNARIVVSGNNLLLQVLGAAGQTIDWKVRYKIVRV